jgi:pyridoxamine 5'-phosphate oxidase
MQIDSFRNEYNYSGLTRQNAASSPFKQFGIWMKEALSSYEKEPTAMMLSTIGLDGFPQSRIVLLKYFDEAGFVFFTNYNSAKGKEIEVNNLTSLHFFWATMGRQVHISGYAEKTSREISEKYFHSRPAESQISAWASEQSSEISSRKQLEKLFSKFNKQYENQVIPLPPFWGGYCIVPIRFEFWQGRTNRLHDRILYEKIGEKWATKRLAP